MNPPGLLDRLRALLSNFDTGLASIDGPCLILGSAPNPVLPVGYAHHWTFVSVNASQACDPDGRLCRPDLTVMSGQMLGSRPENLAGQQALRSRSTDTLLYVERGVSAREAVPILQSLDFRFRQLRAIDHWQRAGLTYRVLGEHLATGPGEDKISTGLFAVLLASTLGGGPIVLSGFSLSSNGHAYNALQHRRQHRCVDQLALGLLALQGRPIYTSDPAFAAESSLPLWDAASPWHLAVRRGEPARAAPARRIPLPQPLAP